ncbi:hypothetical protein [Roseateles aquatilis]|uniref:hypothetical protein n=1 Tax=Roseateles aquatilis TaxID=431061 RepID=UPI0011306FE5|nr:hypothetical protein [Roseateles aquatilis]
MTVLDLLTRANRAIAPTALRRCCRLTHEKLYAELVHLEAQGLARGIPRCFRRRGHMPEAGWISLQPQGEPA